MKHLLKSLALAGLVIFAWSVSAAEISDLAAQETYRFAPVNYPLGLPELVWWTIGIGAAVVAIRMIFGRYQWFMDRLGEPSTHVAFAVVLACGGLFVNSLSMDPVPMGQGMLLAGAVFAFVGMIGKDREGPLL